MISLRELGFEPPVAGLLTTGGTYATVNFIDSQHLLVTFGVRRLMHRLPDDNPSDQDHMVEAMILELPTGKVVARTTWRLHDLGQFLWPVAHGFFLLRTRDDLNVIAPGENLQTADPFTEQPFLHTDRMLVAVLFSPNRDLLTVETQERPSPGDSTPVSQRRTQLNFYRFVPSSLHPGHIVAQIAGGAIAPAPLDLSLTSSGYIETSQESPTRWLFDFDSYTGKYVELSPFDTSCRPRPIFVSATEFIAFGCRGSDDKVALGGFNMKGEQMWQEDSDSSSFPSLAYAPSAGRFALSRNSTPASSGMTANFAPSDVTTQQIRVYQTYNGKQLLQVEATPVQRGGQNFDLSPDGMEFAVIHNGAVEVYTLPALTAADQAGIKADQEPQPEETQAMVKLVPHERPHQKKAAAATASAQVDTAAPVFSVPSDGQSATAQPATVSGDTAPIADDQTPRKRPTLYNEPGEVPPDESGHPPK